VNTPRALKKSHDLDPVMKLVTPWPRLNQKHAEDAVRNNRPDIISRSSGVSYVMVRSSGGT
jgi:hypothetical protein